MALFMYWMSNTLETPTIRHSISHFDLNRGPVAYCGHIIDGPEASINGDESICSLCALEMALQAHGRIHGTTIHELEDNHDGEAA